MQPSQTKAIDNQLVKMITKGGHALSLVAEPEFQGFVKMLCPTYSLPSKQTVRDSLIPKIYNEVHTCHRQEKCCTLYGKTMIIPKLLKRL